MRSMLIEFVLTSAASMVKREVLEMKKKLFVFGFQRANYDCLGVLQSNQLLDVIVYVCELIAVLSDKPKTQDV